MKANQWSALARIADAKFTKQAEDMRKLQNDVAAHVQKRNALKDMTDAARDALRDLHPLHNRNGDVLWQSWVGRNLRQLNIEAAQLSARRETLKPALRKAFGQKLACDEIVKKATKPSSSSG